MPVQTTPEPRVGQARRGWAWPRCSAKRTEPLWHSRLRRPQAHPVARALACPRDGWLAAPRTCAAVLSPVACRAGWPRPSRSAPSGSPGAPPARAHPQWAEALPEAAQTALGWAAAPRAAHESPAHSATAAPCAIPVWVQVARRIAGRAAPSPNQPRSPGLQASPSRAAASRACAQRWVQHPAASRESRTRPACSHGARSLARIAAAAFRALARRRPMPGSVRGSPAKTRKTPVWVAQTCSLDAGRLAAESVSRGHLPHARDVPLARDILREELAQLPQTLRFRPRAQQRIQKIQVRQPLRQLKAELRVVQVRLGRGRPQDTRF